MPRFTSRKGGAVELELSYEEVSNLHKGNPITLDLNERNRWDRLVEHVGQATNRRLRIYRRAKEVAPKVKDRCTK